MKHTHTTRVILNPLFYAALLYAGILGLIGGVITICFISVFEGVQHILWSYLPNQLGIANNAPIYAISLCALGGLLVGLLVRRLGQYPISLEAALKDFKSHKQFDYQHIPQAFIISIVSLGFGAALGPEAALTAIIGGLSTWVALKIKFSAKALQVLEYTSITATLGAVFGTFLGSAVIPLDDEKSTPLPKAWLVVPGIVAALAAFWVFSLTRSSGEGYFHLNLLPYAFSLIDILWAIPIALAGAATGLLFIYSGTLFDRLARPFTKSIVIKAMIGGLGLGILASLTSLALFSGHEGIQTIIDEYAVQSGLALLGVALVKILAANICLATGWKGGRFFPIMFAGAAVGLALTHFLPIPAMLGLAGGMSSALAVLLRKPFVAMVFVVFFFPPSLYLFVAIAALFGAQASKLLPIQNT